MGPALAILELGSIARGYYVLDAMAKRAVVSVMYAEPITPGKYWIAIEGGEAEVEEALNAGIDAAGPSRLDHTLLPNAHDEVMSALTPGARPRPGLLSIGVLELTTLSAAIRAADAAVKAAEVTLVDLHLARGIGGKGYAVVTGELYDVEAAIEAGVEAAGEPQVVGREIIANPDEAVHAASGRRVSR